MNNKLLITTAIVGLSFASSAIAAERPTYYSTDLTQQTIDPNLPVGGMSNINSVLNSGSIIEGAETNIQNAGLKFTNVIGETNAHTQTTITENDVDSTKTGTFSMTGGKLTMSDVEVSADKTISMTGGLASVKNTTMHAKEDITLKTSENLKLEGSSIKSDKAINLGGNIDFVGTGNVLEANNIKFDGINANVADNSLIIKGTNAPAEVSFKNDNTVNLTSDFNVAKLNTTIEKNATLTLNNNGQKASFNVLSGTLKNEGTLNANASFSDASTYNFSINDTATSGGLINGDVVLNGDVNLKTDVSHVKLGATEYKFINGNVDADNGKWVEDFGTNNLYNVALNDDNNALNFNKKSTGEIASNTGANNNQTGAISSVLDGTSNNQSFNNVANNISTLLQSSNSADVAKGLKMVDQMSADTSSSAQTTTSQTATQVFNAVGTRLSGGSIAGSLQGKSSGDSMTEGGAVWAQGLINKAELDGANGFDSDTSGIAFGAEKQINDSTKLGIGYAYSQTDIDSDSRKTDVDTHTAIAYGEYKPSNWFVNGIATYGWGSYDESNAVKKASYDVDSIGLQAMTGYDIKTNVATFTPETGLRYVNINQKAYTDSLGNKISGGKSDILTGVAGIKVSKDFETQSGMILKPEMRIAATYDLSNDDANSVITLANGSSYMTNGEALDKFGMEFGAGLTADINDNVEMSVGYEGRFRTDYSDHTGLVNAKYKF